MQSTNSGIIELTKILFVASNPHETSRLRIAEEGRDIKDELKKAKNRDQFDFFEVHGARISDLQDSLLEHHPHIIHFSGHGESEGIKLQDPHREETQFVGNDALTGLFELFADELQLVFLNSCYSQSQAESLRAGLPVSFEDG